MTSSGPILQRVLDRVRVSFPYYKKEMLPIRSKTNRLVLPRWMTWYLLRSQGKTYPWIARVTGDWNHTTVMHGVQEHIRGMLDPDSRLNKDGINVTNTAKLMQDITNLEERIAKSDREIDTLTYERRMMFYRLNDLREMMYEANNKKSSVVEDVARTDLVDAVSTSA